MQPMQIITGSSSQDGVVGLMMRSCTGDTAAAGAALLYMWK
jgi:hypothetical protein